MPSLIFNLLISAIEISICLSLLIELVFEGFHLVLVFFSLIFESPDIIFNLRHWYRFLTQRARVKLLLRT